MKTTSIIRTFATLALLWIPEAGLFAQYPMGGTDPMQNHMGTEATHYYHHHGTNWMAPVYGCVQYSTQARQHAYHIRQATWMGTHRPLQCRTQLRQCILAVESAYVRFHGSLTDFDHREWYDHLASMDQQHEQVLVAWRSLNAELSKSFPNRLRLQRLAEHLRVTLRDWGQHMTGFAYWASQCGT